MGPARVGLVAVVDLRPNLGARGEWVLSEAVLLQLAHDVACPDGLSQPAPCKVAQAKPNVDGVSRPAIPALDERGDPLIHGMNEPVVSDCLKFASLELQVRVDCVLGDGRDALVKRRLKVRGQWLMAPLTTRGGAGPLGDLTHVARAVLADEHSPGSLAPIEVPEQVAENAPPRRWGGTGELVGRPRTRRP